MSRTTAILLLALSFYGGAANAAISSNDTTQLLSSGLVKLGSWQAAYDKASALVEGMTTSEKISIITGGSGGNFTALNKLDSSTNPLTYFYVTTWPAGLAMAMTWDRDAINGQGNAVASEFRGKGVNLMYAPTLEPLGRSAWCGRTDETYGPDSYLNGILGGNFVKGAADAGVIPSAKHFILNEQETNRMGSTGGGGAGGGDGGAPGGGNDTMGTPPQRRQVQTSNSSSSDSSSSEAYSVVVDDKAFHETYLAPFYDTVKNGIGGVMCAMNRINGSYACENQEVLGKHLKLELGFPGFVHPDAGAQHTGLDSANAGLDYGSSSYWSNSTLGVGLSNGSFTEARLNDMAIRNIMGYYQYNQDQGYPSYANPTDYVDVRKNHKSLARSYGAASIVLLKNENGALPLSSPKSVSIFGTHAGPRYVGPNSALSVYNGVGPTLQGHMAQVGGSAMGSFPYLMTPFQALSESAYNDGFMLRWWLNDTATTQFSGMGGSGTELSESVPGVAADSDVCLVFINAYSGEGGDRSELYNTEQDELVNTVANNCNNTIVVINTTGPRLVDQWITHENVTGVLYGGPLGQESGYAINDVLFGAVNPSGRLVHTIAKNESDYDPNTAISEESEIDFSEGNYIDYKYFDKYNVTPRYEFGYGLSYTTFTYGSDITVQKNSSQLQSQYATGYRAIGGREDLWDIVATVTTSLSNSGSVAGAEIAQLYVSFPDAAGEPLRQLRGFQKVTLQPGASETVTFELRRRDISVWDTDAQNWKIESGSYTFYVGASSRDLKSKTTVTI